jgi:hypothetical protein
MVRLLCRWELVLDGSNQPALRASRCCSPGRPPRSEKEKLLLPVLRNPARSNQHRDDTVETEWDDYRRFRRRRRREPKPQLAIVYLPPVFPIDGHHRRHHRATKPKSFGRQQSRRHYSSSDESSSASSSDNEEEDRGPQPLSKTSTMRSQRMRSLAAISKLQHDATTTIQVRRAGRSLAWRC